MNEMDPKTVEDYIVSLPNAVREYPFGEGIAVYKAFVSERPGASHLDAAQGSKEERVSRTDGTVNERQTQPDAAMRQEPEQAAGSAGRPDQAVRGDWKMFALIAEGKLPVNLSLKCDPGLSQVLRERYETVLPGYHLNKKHWNTIILTGQLSWQEVQDLIRHSYQLVTGQDAVEPTVR